MTKCVITLHSKNKKALRLFLKFIHSSLEIQKLQMPISYKKNKNKKQKITVLKSPHVNKTAHEHFELKTYSLSIVLHSYKIQKYILFLKKIKNRLFPGIKIKNKGYFLQKNTVNSKPMDPNNFKFQVYQFNTIKQTLSFKKLKVFQKINSDLKNKKLIKKIIYKLNVLNYYGSV